MNRREFLRVAAGAPLVLAAAPGAGSPYGELLPPDELGLMLPPGFRARVIAQSGEPVGASGYVWHVFPDGGATFPADDGGWVYVSNSEMPDRAGGVGALRFAADGEVVDAYSICTGTSRNCAGGPTPWGTWLTCEEVDDGEVWECDPTGSRPAQRREGLGAFSHEAVACDPVERTLYLTEDADAGRFYRFTPTRWEDLTAGRLDVARTDETGRVEWLPADATGGTTYAGGEGIAYYDGQIVFTTKSDQRIRAYDPSRSTMEVLHEPGRAPEITGPDNEVFASNGDLYVCEDVAGEPDLVLLAADGSKASVMRMTGQPRSELAGAAFDPSGTRLYVSSQRGAGGPGLTYELSGPFDQLASAAAGSTSTGTTAGGAARADDTGGASSDDDSMLPVAGAVGATVVVALGGLAWLRNRRGTSTS